MLKKLPDTTDGTQLYDWARFIAAETEEELEMAAQANQQVRRAAVKLRELSADEKARDMLERREKGRRDLAMLVADAKREGEQRGEHNARVEVATNMLKLKIPTAQIITATGLTREEIEALSLEMGKTETLPKQKDNK